MDARNQSKPDEGASVTTFDVYLNDVLVPTVCLKGTNPLTGPAHQLSSHAVRFIVLRPDCLLLLTKDHSLYQGYCCNIDKCGRTHVAFYYLRSNVSDVQYCSKQERVYIRTADHAIYYCPMHLFCRDYQCVGSASVACGDNVEIHWLRLQFDPYELVENEICIKQMACSAESAIFVSETGNIYSLEQNRPDVTLDNNLPKLVYALNHATSVVLDLVAGHSCFAFLIAQKCGDKCALLNSSNINNLKCDANFVTGQEIGEKVLLSYGDNILNAKIYILKSLTSAACEQSAQTTEQNLSIRMEKVESVDGICSIRGNKTKFLARTVDNRLFHISFESLHGLNEMMEVSKDDITYYDQGITPKLLSKLKEDVHKYLKPEGNKCINDQNLDELCQRLQMPATQTATVPLFLVRDKWIIYNKLFFRCPLYQFQCHLYTHLKSTMAMYSAYRRHYRISQIFSLREDNAKELVSVVENWYKILCSLLTIQHDFDHFCCCESSWNAKDLVFIRYYRECIRLYKQYSESYCNIYSIDGFKNFYQLLTNNSQQDNDYNDWVRILQQPFQIFGQFMPILEYLHKSSTVFYPELQAWQSFTCQNRINLELAENSREFWTSNIRLCSRIQCFKKSYRRVILTSDIVALKISPSNTITSPIIILFSDSLCVVTSHQKQVYPLLAIWIKNEKNSISVVTPEKKFALIARNMHDNNLWYDQLERAIKCSLHMNEKNKLTALRNIEYRYSTGHSVYGGVHAFGTFCNGVMHGKCQLQYTSGKVFVGDVIQGVIEGYGRLLIPDVGVYNGNFLNGKYWGYGCLMSYDGGELYEGYFVNGQYHGHGYLCQQHMVYVGNFSEHLKSGYGVEYNAITGDKYLGMFDENKRSGDGIYLTAVGNYFEGVFYNNEPSGKCVALFNNSSYYEGEMTLLGPSGQGKYYIVNHNMSELEKVEKLRSNDPCITGNILEGQLSGRWDNIRINSGSMKVNCQISVYPSSLDIFPIIKPHKWYSLLKDLESELFGDLLNLEMNKSLLHALWNQIINYIEHSRNVLEYRSAPMPETEVMKSSYYQDDIGSIYPRSVNFQSLNINCIPKQICQNITVKRQLTNSSQLLSNKEVGVDYQKHKRLDYQIISKPWLSANALAEVTDILIPQSEEVSLKDPDVVTSSLTNSDVLHNDMIVIPAIQKKQTLELDFQELLKIKQYLNKAFSYRHHPFYHWLQRMIVCFNQSYGVWKIKPPPRLTTRAVLEWQSLTAEFYKTIICRLFPVLPDESCIVMNHDTHELVSHVTLLYPLFLTKDIYSTLFLLYAQKYRERDENYNNNLMYAERLPDHELILTLNLDKHLLAVIASTGFQEAVNELRQLKEKCHPIAMLSVLENCITKLSNAYCQGTNELNNPTILNADIIMPLTLLLLLRAAIPQLGAELALLADLTNHHHFQNEMSGIRGYCFTTLKASYEYIANSGIFDPK